LIEIGILRAATALALATATALAQADPDRAKLEASIPEFKVDSMRPSLAPGLWEVIGKDGELIYVDEATSVAILGNMVELATGRNLTSQRLGEIRSIPFEELPPTLAIKRVRGDGSRRLAIFSDSDCPYCRELEQSLTSIDNVTIYLYLYPLENLHPEAPERSHRIWCSEIPAEAWDQWMLKGIEPAPRKDAACEAPLDEIRKLSAKAWVNGTPGLVFGSGRTFTGIAPAEELERLLAEPPISAAAAGTGASGGSD
jgi:thiol:disulfide interchange protein DsbC